MSICNLFIINFRTYSILKLNWRQDTPSINRIEILVNDWLLQIINPLILLLSTNLSLLNLPTTALAPLRKIHQVSILLLYYSATTVIVVGGAGIARGLSQVDGVECMV